MTVIQVLKLASVFLNCEQEFAPLLETDTDQDSNENSLVDEITKNHFNRLLTSLNLCYSEIAIDYLPLLYCQRITVQNNKIYLSDLTKELKDVYAITSIDDKKRFKFKLYADYIQTNVNGVVDILYSYVPSELTLNSDINNFMGRISTKCLALGTVKEYCYLEGLYDDALLWEQRYKDSLKIETRTKAEIVMPKRRWL